MGGRIDVSGPRRAPSPAGKEPEPPPPLRAAPSPAPTRNVQVLLSPPSSPPTPAGDGLAPSRPPPARKLATPGGFAGRDVYRGQFRRRLAARLATENLPPSLLGGGDRPHGEDLGVFRVSVVEAPVGRLALASTERVGASGKFSFAMGADGVLMAAKSLRTRPSLRGRGKTTVSAAESIRVEVELLRRYFDPRVSLVPYGASGKHVIVMPAGLADLAHLPAGLAADRDLLARAALADVATQLDGMHQDGLLHHDVKPANIVLMPDGRVRLVDMGEARTPAEVKQPSTPAFSAPEWYDWTAEGSWKADVWSLGLSIADVRLPVPASLWAKDADFHTAIRASQELVDGLEEARRGPAPDRMAAAGDAVAGWAGYFRSLRALDPALGGLVLDRMLVPKEARADAAEVATAAASLAAPGAARMAEVCREEDVGPRRQALRIALDLRLADEASAPCSAR